jgi:hypothetical protein
MKTTTYICDKCKESKSQDDLVPIELTYNIARPNSYRHTVRHSRDLCKGCLDKLGLLTELPESPHDEELKKNDRTFESRFIDLLSDLGLMFEE